MARNARTKTVPAQRPRKTQSALFAPDEIAPASVEALKAKATLEEKIAQLERLCAEPWDEPTCRLTASAYAGNIDGIIERLQLIERHLLQMRRDLTAEKKRRVIERLREHRKLNPPTTTPAHKPSTVPPELAELACDAWDAVDYEEFEERFKRRTFEEDMDDLSSSVDLLRKWDFSNLREFYEWATQDSTREGGETDVEHF